MCVRLSVYQVGLHLACLLHNGFVPDGAPCFVLMTLSEHATKICPVSECVTICISVRETEAQSLHPSSRNPKAPQPLKYLNSMLDWHPGLRPSKEAWAAELGLGGRPSD